MLISLEQFDVHIKKDFIAYCEVCEKKLYVGEEVLCDHNARMKAYICMECFSKADKKQLVFWLNGDFREAI